MNVFSIAIAPEGTPGERALFEAAPADLYPAALADMRAAAPQAAQLSTALQRIILPVRDLLTDDNIAITLTPKADVMDWDDAAQIENALSVRASLLEAARLWFTEKLHQAVNHAPMTLRILKDDRYRL